MPKKYPDYKCIHGKRKYDCIPCGGKGICEHYKVKRMCVKCKGTSICVHGTQRYICAPCGGRGVCSHGKTKINCRICGVGYCRHGNRHRTCKGCVAEKIIFTVPDPDNQSYADRLQHVDQYIDVDDDPPEELFGLTIKS